MIFVSQTSVSLSVCNKSDGVFYVQGEQFREDVVAILAPYRLVQQTSHLASATPPPGTMPSATAALVALRASLSFFSLITSTSLEPPT